MRRVYFATQRSVLDFAAPGCQPWVSESQFQELERAQNNALRKITGQTASTPVDALRAEAGVTAYRTHSDRKIAASYEKALRLPPEHPRRMALDKAQPKRLKRHNWKSRGAETTAKIAALHTQREPLMKPGEGLPPWQHSRGLWTVTSSLEGANRTTPEEAKEAVRRTIDTWPHDLTIYTDGSAREGTRCGGSAAIITSGLSTSPSVIETIRTRGRTLTSSYEEEKQAMLASVMWIDTNEQGKKIAICTDSQSLTVALECGTDDTALIRQMLDTSRNEIRIQWIPGHCNIEGNEIADKEANQAREIDEPPLPTTYRAAVSEINRQIQPQPMTHHRAARTYQGHSRKRDESELKSRKEAVLMAQLRAGHCPLLAAYKNLLDPTKDPMCPACQEDCQTVEHWLLECPGTLSSRHNIFGTTNLDLEVLSERPGDVVELARRTLGFCSARRL